MMDAMQHESTPPMLAGDPWDSGDDAGGGDVAVAPPKIQQSKAKPQVKPPDLYRVLLNNDDYTPFQFVVDTLVEFFSMDSGKATQIMMYVHQHGVGVVGVYTRDIAETRAESANDHARKNKYPLQFTVEASKPDA